MQVKNLVQISVGLLLIFLAEPFKLYSQLNFQRATIASGITIKRKPLDYSISNMTGGGAVGDFNNDGWQDIFLLGGGGTPDALYINNQNGTFSDHSAEAGINLKHRGLAVAVGDYNNDGLIDLYVTSLGESENNRRIGAHKLYKNLGIMDSQNAIPIPTFVDVAGINGVATSSVYRADGMGASFGDYDLDGDLDLFVSGYQYHDGNRLFRNDQNGFIDVTEEVFKSALLEGQLNVWAFAPTFIDMDNDYLPELLIAGDYGTSRYFKNQNGIYIDITLESGTGEGAMGMGSAIADYNNDGFMDWYLTSIYSKTGHETKRNGNQFYLGNGNNRFVESSVKYGVNNGGWGWGAVAVDLNHDGFLDIVTTNGWDKPNHREEMEWLTELTRVYVSKGKNEIGFDFVQESVGLIHRDQGRGLINFDYDNDGDQDILIINLDGPVSFFKNDLKGKNINWLRIFLDRADYLNVAPNGFGSKVSIRIGEKWQYRIIHGGNTYLSVSEISAHFGIGNVLVIDEVRINWTDGHVTTLRDVAANQTLKVFRK